MALAKEESTRLVKRQISVQLQDTTHRHLFTMHGIRGQIAHERLMRIARQSLVETAFDTQEHREILEREAQIPTQVFFDRVNIPSWLNLQKDKFYETDPDWKPIHVPTMPSAAEITNEAVHELLGYSGGGGEGSDNPFPESHDLSVADRRLQRVCEWATTEYPKASIHTYGNQGTTNDDRYLRRSSSVFKALVYHTLWLALNPANLTDTKWELLKKNMRTWRNFAKHFAAHATGNDPNVHAGTVYGVDNTFYDGSTVWIWNEVQPRTVLRARVTSDAIDSAINDLPADALPEYGPTKRPLYCQRDTRTPPALRCPRRNPLGTELFRPRRQHNRTHSSVFGRGHRLHTGNPITNNAVRTSSPNLRTRQRRHFHADSPHESHGCC